MPLHSRPYTLDRIARLIINLVLLVGAFFLIRYLSGVLVPFAVAFLLAYLLNPIVDKIQKYTGGKTKPEVSSDDQASIEASSQHGVTFGRVLAVGLTLLLLITLAILALVVFVPLLINEIVALKPLAHKISEIPPPDWLLNLAPYVKWDYLSEQLQKSEFLEYFNPGNLTTIAQELLQKVMPKMWNLISGTWSVIIGLFGLSIIVLYTIFLLVDFDKIQDKWKSYLPPNKSTAIESFIENFNEAMKRYFRGQALVAGTVGIMFSFGFWLINLPMAFVLGLTLGLMNMIPYLQIVGMIPVMLLSVFASMAVYENFWQLPLLTFIVLGSVQIIEDVFLIPKLIGRESGLSPAVILLSLAVWGKLFGMLGLLVAIPMTCLLLVYYKNIILTTSNETPHIPKD